MVTTISLPAGVVKKGEVLHDALVGPISSGDGQAICANTGPMVNTVNSSPIEPELGTNRFNKLAGDQGHHLR
jgi:hypothetical protein